MFIIIRYKVIYKLFYYIIRSYTKYRLYILIQTGCDSYLFVIYLTLSVILFNF